MKANGGGAPGTCGWRGQAQELESSLGSIRRFCLDDDGYGYGGGGGGAGSPMHPHSHPITLSLFL